MQRPETKSNGTYGLTKRSRDTRVRVRETSTSRTTAVSVRPAEEVSYWRTLGKVGVQHPINNKWRIFIWRVFWTNNQGTEQVRPVFVSSYDDGFYLRS